MTGTTPGRADDGGAGLPSRETLAEWQRLLADERCLCSSASTDWRALSDLVDALAAAKAAQERAEGEADAWKRRRDLAVEQCRFLHQDGLTREEWHTRHCGAMQGVQVERARADAAERALADERARLRAVEALLASSCHHCGSGPDADGDHSCPCPHSDSECVVEPYCPRHTTPPTETPAETEGDR